MCLSYTPSANSLMRRCLVRWQDERLFSTFRPRERNLSGFSFNLHFLRVITNAYSIRAEFSGARNFSKSPKKPAGIEGTLSQGVRAFGMRRTRYRGLDKTHLQHLAIATAINVDRLVAWFTGQPRATTRTSRFAALAPKHAMGRGEATGAARHVC